MPGMTVAVKTETDSRHIGDYSMSPLVWIASESRERQMIAAGLSSRLARTQRGQRSFAASQTGPASNHVLQKKYRVRHLID
jgi:hypothetical protein